MTHTTPNKNIHEGRNLKRFREMLGMKQEVLAQELGQDWTQKKISLLEQKETIELPVLQQVAAILHLPVEAIQNFDEEQAISVIANTFTDSFNNSTSAFAHNVNCTFNPVDKMVELYERMLQQQKEMIDRLEQLIKK